MTLEENPRKGANIKSQTGTVLAPGYGRVVERRMDGINPDSQAPERRFPASVISDGLILWCLSSPGLSDLWGMIFELPDGFHFVVDDDPAGPKPYKIHHHLTDIVKLVERSEAIKASLIEWGWVDVDVE